MIKVLVVDDSPTAREALVNLLNADPAIRVIATAANGQEALEAAKRQQPDVVTMDIHMPQMDGYEATRRIMETCPTPVVVVSGSSAPREVAKTFRAIEAGALAIVQRPAGAWHPEHAATSAEVLRAVKLMSEVKVVRRWPRPRLAGAVLPPSVPPRPQPSTTQSHEIVAVGASTGGPQALQAILSGLGKDFPPPVVIVQHMAPGFVHGFAEWLSQASGRGVRVARQGESILPGGVYLAPDGFHLAVGRGRRVALVSDGLPVGPCPSISFLFRSVASVYGPRAVGVLLTGMGKDGAEELKQLKEAGAVTIAQDEESSVVHGMPGEAIRLGAAAWVLPPEGIAAALIALFRRAE